MDNQRSEATANRLLTDTARQRILDTSDIDGLELVEDEPSTDPLNRTGTFQRNYK